MPELNDAWLALIGAILGGSGLKFLDHWLGKAREKDDSASKFREELRLELIGLRDEKRSAEKEADRWQKEYYDLREAYLRAGLILPKEV